MASGSVVPVIDAIAIEVTLANFRPVFGRIASGVGLIIKTLRPHILKRGAPALLPCLVDAAQRAVDRVTELVDGDALIVISVDGKTQEVLFTEARGVPAGPAHSLVLK